MLNDVTLIGYTGGDPILRNTQDGTPVCSLTLATTKKRKDQDEVTQWHRLSFWGKQDEWCNEMITKGTLLCVKGEIEYGAYMTNEPVRHKVNTTDIKVNSFKILKSKQEA